MTALKAEYVGAAPLLLCEAVRATGLSTAEAARQCGMAKSTFWALYKHGQEPTRRPDWRGPIEEFIRSSQPACDFLRRNGYDIPDLWRRIKVTATGAISPAEITEEPEVEMLTRDAMKHWKCFRNPFPDEVPDDGTIFISEENRYHAAVMKDAALHGGFVAVYGEVGSGKTCTWHMVREELEREESVRIVFPLAFEKGKLTAGNLMEAIVKDLSEEGLAQSNEARARQVKRLLQNAAKGGARVLLVIEEAQDLTAQTLKLLKRLREVTAGDRRALGVILIGQTELGARLNEAGNSGLREVIRRILRAEIHGLAPSVLGEYIAHKFKVVNMDIANVMDESAVEALAARMQEKDPRLGEMVSTAYPLSVNNAVVRAMNLAAKLGDIRVTREHIEALRVAR